MANTPKQEILDPEREPAYNDPDISPQDFLLAVMHSKQLPMSARIQAAKDVSVYCHPRLAQVTQDVTAGVTIRIEGGLPALPGTDIIMPNTMSVSVGAQTKAKTNGSGGASE